jgi:hypothetical protein
MESMQKQSYFHIIRHYIALIDETASFKNIIDVTADVMSENIMELRYFENIYAANIIWGSAEDATCFG